MVQLYNLNTVTKLSGNDWFLVYSVLNSGDAKVSLNSIVAYLAKALFIEKTNSQNQVVATNNFNIPVSSSGLNSWLILKLSSAFALGAITLPPVSSCVDGQELIVNCTHQVSTFNVNGNGAIVYGAPSSLSAYSFFKLKFNLSDFSWYRVG